MPEVPAAPDRCTAPRFPWTRLWSRRDLLRVGSLGIAASTLPGWLRGSVRAEQGRAGDRPSKVRSVIVLWMAGGVTHHESFDPKPEAPEEIRGTLAAIDTKIPGVHFAEVMPHLAAAADKIAVLRSYSHDSNDHFLSQAFALSGRKVNQSQILTEPNVGAIVSYLRGPQGGLPGYLAVPGWARPGPPPHNLFVGGWLGQQYGPFAVGGQPAEADFTVPFARGGTPPDYLEEDIRPAALEFPDDVSAARLGRRAKLRERLDAALRAGDAMDGYYQSALHLLSSPKIRAAFDYDQEPTATHDRYGHTKIGQRCLLARRLVEAGARFILVDYGYDPDYGNLWDNHAVPVQRQPHISEMAKKPYHVAGMDRAFAALVCELEECGLLDSTLVVLLTEFGRTPKINSGGGRDHWGMAGSLFFAGAGIPGGQVIGNTDQQGAYPTGRGYSPADVAATIYHHLGIDPDTILYDQQHRPIKVLPEGEPIPGLV